MPGLPDPINKKTEPGYGSAHEGWHEDMHITSNLAFSGTGTPEAAVVAGIGSTFHRTDGGAATSFYVKESGAGNTGWVAK